jgi:Fe-S-cluster containining protein
MSTDVSLCALCAARGLTCCQGADRDIYITLGDLDRIKAFCGRDDFYEFRRPTDPDYADNDEDPVWAACVFKPDGSRRVLKKTAAGCCFLKADGCALPLQIRPLVCRIYPYDYNYVGFYTAFAEGCPVNLLPPGRTLDQCLGMNFSEAQDWHNILYSEIQLEGDTNDNRLDL